MESRQVKPGARQVALFSACVIQLLGFLIPIDSGWPWGIMHFPPGEFEVAVESTILIIVISISPAWFVTRMGRSARFESRLFEYRAALLTLWCALVGLFFVYVPWRQFLQYVFIPARTNGHGLSFATYLTEWGLEYIMGPPVTFRICGILATLIGLSVGLRTLSKLPTRSVAEEPCQRQRAARGHRASEASSGV